MPATAAADGDDSLIRGAFGHGSLLASSSRDPAPPCTTPAANPETRSVVCTAIAASRFGDCRKQGPNEQCDITVTAEAADGWAFRRWAPESTRCRGETDPSCAFRTKEVRCDATGENCTTNLPGPFRLIAEFENRRAPTVAIGTGPPSGAVVFDDARRQVFAFNTDEDDEAPTFSCRRDAGPFTACTTPHTLSSIADGEHSFCVTAADASGKPSAVAACRTWRQETTPTASLVAGPPPVTAATDAAFAYTSNKVGHPADGSALSFECRLDAGAFAPCEASGKRVAGLGDGAGYRIADEALVERPRVTIGAAAHARDVAVRGPAPRRDRADDRVQPLLVDEAHAASLTAGQPSTRCSASSVAVQALALSRAARSTSGDTDSASLMNAEAAAT